MERKIYTYLNRWKRDPERKVLVLYGNKQVGKTYAALKFGEKEYKNTVYLDSENNPTLCFIEKSAYKYHQLKISLTKDDFINFVRRSYYLAKSIGIQAFVKILDGVVDIFFLCGNAAQLITFFYWHFI